MKDVRIAELAAKQFNRVSRRQLITIGLSDNAIHDRVATGRLFRMEEGVFSVAPPLDGDDWGRWMAAVLTEPGTVLSDTTAGAAWGFWAYRRWVETVTRPGNGGPRRHGGLIVRRSRTLRDDTTTLGGIPITTVPRTLIDLTRVAGDRALARAVREAVRLERVSVGELADALGRHRYRRGTARLARTVARYSGLPLERARSGAEVRAMEILRDARVRLPRLNHRVAGAEADLSWPESRLILEIDGGPFHLDVGEDGGRTSLSIPYTGYCGTFDVGESAQLPSRGRRGCW